MTWYDFFISLIASGLSYFFGPEPPPPERWNEPVPTVQVQHEVDEQKEEKSDWGWYVVPGR